LLKTNVPRTWSRELFGKFPKIVTFGGMVFEITKGFGGF
jgi:hypothetical protein